MTDRTCVVVACLVLFSSAHAAAADQTSAADAEFFEAKVRPLLVAKCYECHAAEKQKAGLRLDDREAILAGGESGPAAIVGKPAESLLMDVIGYRSGIQMPPKSKLAAAEIEVLTEWVRRGLPWPNATPSSLAAPTNHSGDVTFSDEQKSFWAFQPVRRVQPPVVGNNAWIRSPIDRFILAELEAQSLEPAKETGPRTLIRRLSLDLIGLLPTVDEVNAYLADGSPDATERLVDRLLASPHYGERWGRHWLDVARYADSNGLDENLAYANAFRYRDYVVRAFRQDKPYDQFLIEQIAGDLLPAPAETAGAEAIGQYFDRLTATGFLCLGAKMLAEDDPVKMQMDIIDEQVDTISRAVMGLTMGCARCHDHKFDPLTAADYYGLAGVFKSTQTMDTFSVVARWHERPLASVEAVARRETQRQQAAAERQSIEKVKAEAVKVALDEARRHTGQYLLAATRAAQLSERLAAAQTRGGHPAVKDLPGAILIEAEDYVRGNVLKERERYGAGIGVLVNRGEAPNFTEYEIDIREAGIYQLELRYAAAASRPVSVSIDAKQVRSDAASKVTGSWFPDTQTWFVEALLPIKAGRHTIRLEQPSAFPHIDKLLLTLETPSPQQAEEIATSSSFDESRLLPSLVAQWSKTLTATRNDPTSILKGWHQFVAHGRLDPQSDGPKDAIMKLLGTRSPESLVELVGRYDALFEEMLKAEQAVAAAGQQAIPLSDPVLEAARLLANDPQGPFAVPSDIEAAFPLDVVTQLKTAQEDAAAHEKVIPKYPETMAVSDAVPVNLRIHLRGSHLTLGKEVTRRIPQILTGDREPGLTEGSGRLELARWLANPSHPLTSRVMANRIWQWHFGQGLVRSPDNFGRLGERPSHPALLDWLACQFSGGDDDLQGDTTKASPRAWTLKAMHRLLTSSAIYRQSTEYRPREALADPENRLLSRFHRQRMDVEVLRDSLLLLGGALDDASEGTLLPTENRAYVTSTANVNPAIYGSSRRAIYLPVVRSALYDVFTAFDFADPSTLNGQRDQTTIAPQALFMMNSQFVLDQSRRLATKLTSSPESDEPGKIQQLYELVNNRPASAAEVARAQTYLARLRQALLLEPGDAGSVEQRIWTSLCRAVLSANEFIYID